MDIPRLAYIEAQIVNRAARAGALLPFAREVEQQYKAEPGTLGIGIFIETRVLGLLYALVLVPRELWELKSNHGIYSRLEDQFSLDGLNVSLNLKPSASALQDFVYHLRNSLAHARFEFIDGRFEFWDWDPKKKVETYRASIQTERLISFLEVVGSQLANYGSWPDTLDS
jgi:hypothetical protein